MLTSCCQGEIAYQSKSNYTLHLHSSDNITIDTHHTKRGRFIPEERIISRHRFNIVYI